MMNMDVIPLENLPPPEDRFKLGKKLTSGVWGILYEAEDSKAGKKVAIKIVNLSKERSEEVKEEYRVYQLLPQHPNISSFLGIFKKQGRADILQAWIVNEISDGGTLADYVRKLHKQNKRLPEEQIAYILREITKAIIHLHENNVVHRNIRADNVFLTADGSVKLSNFGLSTQLKNPEAKLQTCIGSPCWLAPEVAICEYHNCDGYDMKVDVWALGVTAIELGDGKPPLQNMYPTRAIFQITRNPPPTLFRPSNWSQLFNDFVTECLEKNPEHRPYSQELLEHPFFESVTENEKKIQNEIALKIAELKNEPQAKDEFADVLIRASYIEQEQQPPQKLLQEDLASMEELNEETILAELEQRMKRRQYYTFIGDILLAINPHENQDIYGHKEHVKYQFKARSDNSPHIYAVADKAYQDVFHNEEPQHILLSGETMSGKTTNANHAIQHLVFLGQGNKCVEDVQRAMRVIRALGNAETFHNPDSTRHLLQTQITFTTTGKVSGAIFWLYLLDKSCVTISDKKQANFHIFYYFYDALESDGTLPQWNLEGGRDYQYLRANGQTSNKISVRENPSENPMKWRQIESDLKELGMDDNHVKVIKNILAAILLLGELEYDQDDEGFPTITNPKIVESVASLLGVDQKKFSWALLNYCVFIKGEATRRRHNLSEANLARDVLAETLYSRLVDWLVCKMNEKMAIGRSILYVRTLQAGDRHYINVMDLFGFECFSKNLLSQLFINCVNEQLQFHYNQRIFVWEMQEGEEEDIPVSPLPFYDNKKAIDQLLAKPDGFMYILDESSRGGGLPLISERLRLNKSSHVTASTGSEFTVAHYTGRVTYDAFDFPDKNRDFLPPEIIETLRRSTKMIIPVLFTGLLSKSGNLTVAVDSEIVKKSKGRWGAALTAEHENRRARKYNTQSRGQYSQTRQMRTSAATFRGTCFELLKNLAGNCGVHFVRCVRGNLNDQPGVVHMDLLRQQLKALAVVDTARGRQNGYSIRIPFNEFIRRYKFLAFDFDESVDVTRDNCRLLLIRLKMEGWVIGKSKVFLKYYNEEFLNRLYETQVKKIVKVQSMMRAFLAKRTMVSKLQNSQVTDSKDESKPLLRSIKGKTKKDQGGLDEETILFMKSWCKRWRFKSLFQVLLLYRATRHQDLVYFSQQAHLYNQNALSELHDLNEEVNLREVDPKARASFLPPIRPAVRKLPFRLGELPYFDSAYLCDPTRKLPICKDRKMTDESWDAPLQRNIGEKYKRSAGMLNFRDQGVQTYYDGKEYTEFSNCGSSLPETPYVRDSGKGNKLSAVREDLRKDLAPRSSSELKKNDVYREGIVAKKHKNVAPPPPREIVKSTRPVLGHIQEMEDKFRQVDANEDEPPFNFQAVLRKTNYRRESMKRSNLDFSLTNNKLDKDNNNVVYKSDTQTSSDNKAVELAPGFVVHGEVSDL